jgi:hypothetical protein
MHILRMAIRKRDVALISLILVDACLKACAWAFARRIPLRASYSGPIRLGYVENASGFGYDQSRLLGRYGIATDDAFVACTLVVLLLVALAIILWPRIEGRWWLKSAVAVAAYVGAATLALSVHESMSLTLSPYLRGILRALGPLAVAVAVYRIAARPYFEAISLLFLAGTAGNCASVVVPPFAVIDYFGIYRPAIRTYVYANIADAYLGVAMLLMLLVPVYLAARAARNSSRRRASSA